MRRHDYLPFGEELLVGMGNGSIRSASQGYTVDCVRQRFVGYERDIETGLDFVQARYYSSIQGRFTSVDPYDPLNSGEDIASRDYYILQPQNWNRYAFALNNPHKYVDPDGKNPLLTAALGAVGGAAFGAGLEAAKAIYRGESLTDSKVLQRIGAKALNGAIVGGVAGLTGNLAAGQAAAALALGSIGGGIAERAVDGNEQTQALSASSIAIDGVAGLAGGYAAQKTLAYAGDLTYAMRQGAYESYASISGSLFKSLEQPYLQSALNTFKYTYNSGLEQKVQGAVRGATKAGTTFGLTQLQILYIQYESAKRRNQESNAGEGKITKLCDPNGNNCTSQ
jgi:RHS repeat-associated protein